MKGAVLQRAGSSFFLLLFLLLVGCTYKSDAADKSETSPEQELLKAILDDTHGPFSPWLSFKSDISASDIKRLANVTKNVAAGRSVEESLPPVIIIPSLVGSVLDATLKDFRSHDTWCPSNWPDPFTLWIDDSINFLLYVHCWFDHIKLKFNPVTNTSSDTPGVFVDAVDYGGVKGVSYLDVAKRVGLWNDTIAVLEAIGYEAGKSLRAAPFDWRRGPAEFMRYEFPRLKDLIEETYALNGNKKVAIISLSMGGPFFLTFLSHSVDQQWKDTYIHSYTSLEGAFGGSMQALMSIVNPNFLADYAFPLLLPYSKIFQSMMRSFVSFAWMFPIKQFLGPTLAKVTLPHYGTYTTRDWLRLLQDSGAPETAQALGNIYQQEFTTFKPPGVRTYCVFGYGVETIEQVHFLDGFDSNYQITYGDGDGTVLAPGLDMCSRFQSEQRQPMTSYPIKGMVHGTSVHNKQVIAFILKHLLS